MGWDGHWSGDQEEAIETGDYAGIPDLLGMETGVIESGSLYCRRLRLFRQRRSCNQADDEWAVVFV